MFGRMSVEEYRRLYRLSERREFPTYLVSVIFGLLVDAFDKLAPFSFFSSLSLTGFWPFNYSLCNIWVSSDVLCCSSSIYHMVFISIGRFIGIRNPLRARQASLIVSRRAVIYKIALAWLLSALVSCPITILAIMDPKNIQPDPKSCFIDNHHFLIFGEFDRFLLSLLMYIHTHNLVASQCHDLYWYPFVVVIEVTLG